MVKNLPSTDKTDQECPYISRQEWEDRGNSFGKADMRLVEIESEFYKYSENKKREIVKAFEAAISDIIAQLQIRTGFLLQDDLPSGLGKQYTMFEKTFANPQAWRLAQRPVVASAFGCKGWLEFDPSWMQPIDDTDTESLGRTIAAIQVYHDVHTAVYRFGPHFNGVWGCETCFDMQKSMTCKVKDLEIGSNKGCLYCQFLFGTLFDSIDTWKRPGKYYGDNGSIFQNHYDILELKLDWNGNVYPPRVVLSYGVSKVDDNDDEDEDSDEDAMISVDFTYKFWKYHEICVVMPWRRPSKSDQFPQQLSCEQRKTE